MGLKDEPSNGERKRTRMMIADIFIGRLAGTFIPMSLQPLLPLQSFPRKLR